LGSSKARAAQPMPGFRAVLSDGVEGSRKAPVPAAMGGVKLIVFDFDQTLSIVHVFKSLAGWADRGQSSQASKCRVSRPFACTERGQVRRIRELDKMEPFKEASFSVSVFGGEARVEQIRQTLCTLKERDTELVICTKGFVGVVKRCLSDLGLLDFFTEVYGNIGCGTYGETAYDRAADLTIDTPEEALLLGTEAQADWLTKDRLVMQLMRRSRLRREQALLVEDDPDEIRRAGSVCRTLWVREAEGMTPEHLTRLRRLTEPSCSFAPAPGAKRAAGSAATACERPMPSIAGCAPVRRSAATSLSPMTRALAAAAALSTATPRELPKRATLPFNPRAADALAVLSPARNRASQRACSGPPERAFRRSNSPVPPVPGPIEPRRRRHTRLCGDMQRIPSGNFGCAVAVR